MAELVKPGQQVEIDLSSDDNVNNEEQKDDEGAFSVDQLRQSIKAVKNTDLLGINDESDDMGETDLVAFENNGPSALADPQNMPKQSKEKRGLELDGINNMPNSNRINPQSSRQRDDVEDKVLEETKVDQSDQNDPFAFPDVVTALQIFPDKDPSNLLQLYKDCGMCKEIYVETLMQMNNIGEEQIQNAHGGSATHAEPVFGSSLADDPLDDLVGLGGPSNTGNQEQMQQRMSRLENNENLIEQSRADAQAFGLDQQNFQNIDDMDEDSRFAAQLQAQEIHDARQEAQQMRQSISEGAQGARNGNVARGLPVNENDYYDSEEEGDNINANGLTQEEKDRQVAEQIMMMQMQQDVNQDEIRKHAKENNKKKTNVNNNVQKQKSDKEESIADKFFSLFGCGPKSKPKPGDKI